MGDMIVRSSGGLAVNDGPSVLGEQKARIRVGGKIRAGIKVLTATGRAHQKAQGIYDAGVAAGKKWETIERELIEKCGFDKSPLTPKNAQYFSVFRADFDNPAMADQIMALYGEEIGGQQRLIRFPVMFPTDSWQANLPHGLHSYASKQLKYWSDYDPAGNRRCLTRKPVEKDPRSQRAVRQWGGREAIPRPDTDGMCNPMACGQYQSRVCNLTADLLFYIPGIIGAGAISLPFKSFYAMDQARQMMALVAYMRGGRISGTLNGRPIFYITKKMQDVPMLDPKTGEPTRMPHWIITLEADLDMLQVFASAEQRQMLSERGAAAALALSTPEIQEPDDHDGDDDDGAVEGELMEPAAPTTDDPRAAIGAARAEVAHMLEPIKITPEVFSSWMAHQTGNPKWSREIDGLNKAIGILREALKGDIEAWKKLHGLDAPF